MEEAFSDGIFAVIPEDQNTVTTSVNKGHPFCDSPKYDKLRIGNAIAVMCRALEI